MKKYTQKINTLFTALIAIVFAGSVFLSSDNFVSQTNTPKSYFVVVSLLVTIILLAGINYVSLKVIKSKAVYWSIYVVCSLQACYGICQFMDWLPSSHSVFAITGSFDNPAGFAAVLAMGFPTGLFLFSKAKRIEKYIAGLMLLVIAIAVFISGSRAGVLAIFVSSVFFFFAGTKAIGRFVTLKGCKFLSVLILSLFVSGVFILYSLKKDSANGRLLIWKVSSEMIKEKPAFGHGYGMFQAKYMDYQAEYFKNNPHSRYALLADNVKHPFNEFIKLTVEFGIVGLIVVLLLFGFVLWKIVKSENKNKGLVFSGLVSFFVFACFSYPLQYITVWLFLAFYLATLLPSKKIRINNTPVSIFARGITVITCVFFLFHTCRQIRAEIRWKTIAVSSLQGNTEAMLPEYEKLYLTSLNRNPFFLYNYGAELNVAGEINKSTDILKQCQKRFNDYDLQTLLADNYSKKGEYEKAIQIYEHASNMIPNRFLPLYRLVKLHQQRGNQFLAFILAKEILNKEVKIKSATVSSIKREMKEIINNKNTGLTNPD